MCKQFSHRSNTCLIYLELPINRICTKLPHMLLVHNSVIRYISENKPLSMMSILGILGKHVSWAPLSGGGV